MDTLFSGLIPSKTRIRLLVRFFFNPKLRSYLRELAKEFGVSSNSVRKELNQLTRTNLLKSERNGRQVFYMANEDHPLFPELRSMVSKVMGIDQVIDGIVNELGDVEEAYLIDDYAEGKDSGIIENGTGTGLHICACQGSAAEAGFYGESSDNEGTVKAEFVYSVFEAGCAFTASFF